MIADAKKQEEALVKLEATLDTQTALNETDLSEAAKSLAKKGTSPTLENALTTAKYVTNPDIAQHAVVRGVLQGIANSIESLKPKGSTGTATSAAGTTDLVTTIAALVNSLATMTASAAGIAEAFGDEGVDQLPPLLELKSYINPQPDKKISQMEFLRTNEAVDGVLLVTRRALEAGVTSTSFREELAPKLLTLALAAGGALEIYIPGDLSKLNPTAQAKLRGDVRGFVVTSTSANDSDVEGVDLFAGSIIAQVRFKQGAIDLEASTHPAPSMTNLNLSLFCQPINHNLI